MNQNLNNQHPNQMPNVQNQMPNPGVQGQPQRPNQTGLNQAGPNQAGQFIRPQQPQQQPAKKKKKIFSKELVTIIGVLLIVAIIYFAYNYQLKKDTEMVSQVPTAATKIAAGHEITIDDIKYIEVPAKTLAAIGALTSIDQIRGYFVNIDTVIPEGAFFYSSSLSATEPSPDAIFKELGADQVAVTIPVDLESTYGNSIMPGNFVDLYVKADKLDSKGNVNYLIGPLVYNAKVLAIKDSSGKNVFADKDNIGSPSMFIFGMNSDINTIMLKAKRLQSTEYNIEIFPVVNGKFAVAENETLLSQNEIKDLIETATVKLEEQE